MGNPNTPAPLLQPGGAVMLFDGTCKLCNGWAEFVIQHDLEHRIQLATVQSAEGQRLLAWTGLPTDRFNTIVFVADNQFSVRSAAMFKILQRLPAPWRWLTIAQVIPGAFRDWLYDRIALNRYRLFGRYDACRGPAQDHEQRYLHADPSTSGR